MPVVTGKGNSGGGGGSAPGVLAIFSAWTCELITGVCSLRKKSSGCILMIRALFCVHICMICALFLDKPDRIS